jgi:hypothetical protein
VGAGLFCQPCPAWRQRHQLLGFIIRAKHQKPSDTPEDGPVLGPPFALHLHLSHYEKPLIRRSLNEGQMPDMI